MTCAPGGVLPVRAISVVQTSCVKSGIECMASMASTVYALACTVAMFACFLVLMLLPLTCCFAAPNGLEPRAGRCGSAS